MTAALALTSPELYAVTHPGLVHHTNEDSWAVLDAADGSLLLMICDGMGGMGHGDEASQLAIRSLLSQLSAGGDNPGAAMLGTLTRIDVQLREALCGGGKGLPGTTAVLVWVRDGWAQVGWVGDSRAYWIREKVVIERTRDHKLVEELIAAGQLTEAEAKNSMLAHVVTRAIGGRAPDEPAVEGSLVGPWPLEPGDRVVLCSDGVCDLLSDDEIAAAVATASPTEGGDALVRIAIDRGGHDNITAIVYVAGPATPAVARSAADIRGSSLPPAAPTPAPPATEVPPQPRPTPVSVPPAGRRDSPEDEFLRQNRDYTPYVVGAVGSLCLLIGLGGWLLLG
jgi:serine/threonine protein phosphatase PrpC